MSARIILSGFRSIEECLKQNPKRISKIVIAREFSGRAVNPRVTQIKELAQKLGVKVEFGSEANSEEPILALMNEYEYTDFDELAERLETEIADGTRPTVLILDGITDAHNLGAILRTAAFMGVSGVILPKDRAAPVNDVVYRIACGGVEYLSIAQVTNLSSALKVLKDKGFWIVGFSENAKTNVADLECDFSAALVIGNEEKGIRPLILENCDHLVKFNPKNKLQSLNASVAAALAMSWAIQL